jgi:hypothetical protein
MFVPVVERTVKEPLKICACDIEVETMLPVVMVLVRT